MHHDSFGVSLSPLDTGWKDVCLLANIIELDDTLVLKTLKKYI